MCAPMGTKTLDANAVSSSPAPPPSSGYKSQRSQARNGDEVFIYSLYRSLNNRPAFHARERSMDRESTYLHTFVLICALLYSKYSYQTLLSTSLYSKSKRTYTKT